MTCKLAPPLSGWVDKAVLLPLVRAVFSYRLKDSEMKVFLSSPSLKAMVNTTPHHTPHTTPRTTPHTTPHRTTPHHALHHTTHITPHHTTPHHTHHTFAGASPHSTLQCTTLNIPICHTPHTDITVTHVTVHLLSPLWDAAVLKRVSTCVV